MRRKAGAANLAYQKMIQRKAAGIMHVLPSGDNIADLWDAQEGNDGT